MYNQIAKLEVVIEEVQHSHHKPYWAHLQTGSKT